MWPYSGLFVTELKELLSSFEDGDREHKDRLSEIADGSLCFFNDQVSTFPESHLTALFGARQDRARRRELGGQEEHQNATPFMLELSNYYKPLTAELILDIVDFMNLRLDKNPDSSGYFQDEFFLTSDDRHGEDLLVGAGGFHFGGRRLISQGHFYDLNEFFVEDIETTSWRDWKLWERNDDPSHDRYQTMESLSDVPQIMMKPLPEPRQFGSWKGGTWTAVPAHQQLAFSENLVAVHEGIFSNHEDLVALLGLLYLHPGTDPDARRLIGEAMAPLFDDFPIPT